ncbi:MAG TPA: NAD(P)/FAD-dependent oxidoreductase [Rhodopila sp.]|uniref:NAD(P)/FAD-dependent oxidoreductase n=1 Tax=Rhodopila sp. TaxID=2480087 RepID=UPI002C11ABCB|nr:NAD(P)/FAD-dependent oxidoreductase [Rhodopila sp.]HVY15188.1 NAD(P)/FAD-dependent oxidoreductase [Rhodopila sp.]
MPDDAPFAAGLDALAARVRDDLARIAHPRLPWMEPVAGPDGKPALDVLIVGGGQSGVAIAHGLMRAHVDNVLVVDKAPRGLEGPWLTYARMPTLRSPKDYTGPDLDLPSLAYQSWHEAVYGPAHWQALELITRQDWAAYLLWVRDVTGVPVANETELVDIAPVEGLLEARFAGGGVRYARKIVLATGQDGGGTWWMPDFVAALPVHVRAHTADPIDFAALRGRRVAVLGAGASALDNAAMALEAGARDVALFCRRAEPQVIQPFRWLTFAGFLRHLSDLDDAWRWRFMSHILGLREGFPQPTWDRCARHPAFRLLTGRPWTGARMAGDAVLIDTPAGPHEADFLICGTGIMIDFAARPELGRCAGNIARWRDRYDPQPAEADGDPDGKADGEADDRLADFPYLGPDFALLPRQPGLTDWMRDVHMFNIASTMSFGPSGASINAMTTAVPKLVSGLTRGLFTADVEKHWRSLRDYDVPQAILTERKTP